MQICGRKGSVYEGGHRVPCFFYWPAEALKLNREINEVTSVTDLLPTFIDICNLQLEKPIKINDIEKEKQVTKDKVEFSVKSDAGDAELKTWFYTTAGDIVGAYYVDVRLK